MTTAKQNVVQYYVVNEELGMSAGKIAAQAAHAATMMMVHYLLNDEQYREAFETWFSQGQTKIVLRGREEDLQRLGREGFVSIRDAGHTEIPAGSLTVVVLPPMEKEAARQYVGSLKLY